MASDQLRCLYETSGGRIANRRITNIEFRSVESLRYHLISALPQVKPPPKTGRQTR